LRKTRKQNQIGKWGCGFQVLSKPKTEEVFTESDMKIVGLGIYSSIIKKKKEKW
jgi:hypothetical protein